MPAAPVKRLLCVEARKCHRTLLLVSSLLRRDSLLDRPGYATAIPGPRCGPQCLTSRSKSAMRCRPPPAGPIDAMGRAARLPTKESRVKWRGGNPPTNDCCTQRTASAQAAVRAKVLPNLIEPRAVRAAVKTASRLTVGLAASLDRRCARRSIDFAGRDGETGAQAEQRNLTLATRGFGRFQ